MTWPRRLSLPVLLVLLGLGAAPAQATLVVRSDGAGLLVRDKHGLDDQVRIKAAYTVTNENPGDIFPFERQVGCTGSFRDAFCARNGPIMTISLGLGKDTLLMENSIPAGHSIIDVGTGDDFVGGHLGRDDIVGSFGEDRVFAKAGNDVVSGDSGSDQLDGGDGNDTVTGGSGSDVVVGGKGVDTLRGSTGNDFVNSKEPQGATGVADEVNCGDGFDTAEADLKDTIPASCEEFEQSPVGETPNVRILGKALRVSATGKVNVRLRCPGGVKTLGCKGRLQLALALARKGRAGASRSRKVGYKIAAGKRKTVTLRLSSKDVKTLRGRKQTRGLLVSVEKGRKGRKTTVRNPRLKLRGG